MVVFFNEKTSYHLSDFVFVTHYLILERPIFYNCFSLICSFAFIRFSMNIFCTVSRTLVGTSGLEPPTSRLSGARSNQLSYAPVIRHSAYRSVCRPLDRAFMGTPNLPLSRASAFPPLSRSHAYSGNPTDPIGPKSQNPIQSLSRFTAARTAGLVEMMGFEPMTPCLQGRCSPN